MKPLVGILVAALGFSGARGAHALLESERRDTREDEPFAPTPDSAPFLSIGYREVAADLLLVRMIGYFGGKDSTADGIASLAEAIVALDPKRYRAYEFGARAMTLANFGVDQATFHRAIALLDRGRAEFPPDWRIPYLEGQIYTQDLKTDDPKQRRAWDDAGTTLVESAIRKPHAPTELATWASVMRTRMGQLDRAITGLREMLLVTSDDSARERIIDRLAELENKNADVIAGEVLEARERFLHRWHDERPALPASMYLLLGKRPEKRFDLGELAMGGHGLFGSQPDDVLERLDPPSDP